MPYFDYDGDIRVDVDEFLSACDSSEIEEIIEALKEDGYLSEYTKSEDQKSNMSITEREFENALDKLRGNWNRLTAEEEQAIINIAKKF